MITTGHFREGDGWVTTRDDDGTFGFMMWVHEPSHRCVAVHATRRCNWIGAVWGDEPADRNAPGYSVTCRVHDELGNPVEGEGFWVASFECALLQAQKYRAAVLADRYKPSSAVQLTLDEAVRP